MGSPIPAAAAPIEQAATVVHQWTDAQLTQLIKALTPQPGMVATAGSDVKAFIAKVESEINGVAQAGVADVKKFPWAHVVTYIASVATPIGIHLLGLFGL